MNIIDLQDNLKNLPENALMKEMQQPTGSAPPFLILGELKRRKQMRDDYNRQQNSDMKTVAEETVTAAGMPQDGIMQASRSLTPKTNMAQNTGVASATPVQPTQAPQPQAPQMMSGGGIMRMARGGRFGTDIEYNYKTFLQENNLNDTPYAQDMFDRLKETMDNKYATEGPNNNPRIYDNAIGFERSPQGLGSVSTEINDFIPGAGVDAIVPGGAGYDGRESFMKNITDRGLRDLENQAGRSMITDKMDDIRVTRDSSQPFVMPAPPEEPSILDQLRGSVYSNNPLEDALSDVEIDPSSLLPDTEGYYSQFPLSQQDNMNTAEDSGLEGRVFNAMLSRGDSVLPPESAASIAAVAELQAADARFDNIPTPGVQASTTPRLSESGSRPPSIPELDVPDLEPIAAAAQTATAPKYTIQDYGLLPVGSVSTPEEKIEAEVASLNAQIAAAGDDEVLIDLLNRRKNGLVRRLQIAEAQTDTGEFLSNIPTTVDRGFQKYIAPGLGLTTPEEAATRINTIDASRADATAAERAREAKIAALVGGATTVPTNADLDIQADFPQGTKEGLAAASQANKDFEASLLPKGTGDAGTTTGTSTGTSTGGAGFGSMDSRIAQMLSSRQKEAESDKWMALAMAGMELMKPTSTIGEGFGNAGQAGLGYLQQSKQGTRAFETDMLKLQTQLDIAQQRARSSGLKGSKIPSGIITNLQKQLDTKQAELGSLRPPEEAGIFSSRKDPDRIAREALEGQIKVLRGQISYALQTQGVPVPQSSNGNAAYDLTQKGQ